MARRARPGWLPLLGVLIALFLSALLHAQQVEEAAGPDDAQQAGEPPAQPVDTGLLETAEVSLIVLDVEVVDKRGRPIRGLTLEDFTVRMSGREWPIDSVDDFCTCDTPTVAQDNPARGESAGNDAAVAPATGEAADIFPGAARQPGAAGGPARYVLYFDFSQLAASGRIRAREAAIRWVKERMEPEDEVMVVGHAFLVGLRELSYFTSQQEKVLAAIETAFASKELLDPFPSEYIHRVDDCNRCVAQCIKDRMRECEKGCCQPAAFEDYRHGKGSLEAMDRLFVTLEQVPGRKAVIHFTQTGMIFPTQMYPLRDKTVFGIGDHIDRVSRVGASGVAARVAIHTATLPPEPGWARIGLDIKDFVANETTNMGSNLAEATGGSYNRSLFDLDGVLDDAGRGCCFYRIALRAPEEPGRRVFRARVQAGKRLLPQSYRVQFMTADERWLRRAQAVLVEPERARGVAVVAALLPHHVDEEGWHLSAQVSFDLDSLTLVPMSGKKRGIWRVGAVVVRDEGEEHWKLLAESQVSASDKGAAGIDILHEHLFDPLPPGSYQLLAFVEDRIQGRFGGAEANLVVGTPGEGVTVGPLARRQDEKVMHLSFPELDEEEDGMSRTTTGAGSVPAAGTAVVRGTTLQMITWICPQVAVAEEGSAGRGVAGAGEEKPAGATGDNAAKAGQSVAEGAGPPPPSMASFIASETGEPLFRLNTVEAAVVGSCFRFEDAIDTAGLELGGYLYNARLQQTELQAEFAVTAAD